MNTQVQQVGGSTVDPWGREEHDGAIAATRRTYTNADALRAGLIPCETDPRRGGLSYLSHTFHGIAAVTVGSFKGNRRHVCEECADKHHKHQERKEGVRWE